LTDPGPPQSRVPGREALALAEVLKAAGPTKADLLVLDLPQGGVVIKDYAGKPWWARPWGRWQIARECRAYAFAGGQPFLPRLLGRVDGLALALERVPGAQLADVHREYPDKAALLAALRTAIDALHVKGIVHLDLRGRENVMVTREGRVVLLDLGGAIWLRPGGLLHRLFFPLLVAADEAAWIKWKEMLSPGNLDAREKAFERRFRRLRTLWIFNPKGAWRRKA
jgi:serine/threonine protein kinase